MTKKVSRLDLSLITGIEDDIFEIDTLYLGGLASQQYATKEWVENLPSLEGKDGKSATAVAPLPYP